MTLSDRQYFAKNISTWQEMFPAIYHGHFAYVDMQNLAVNTGDVKMVNINIVRNPFERMISYYYFLRYGDDFRKNKVRSRMSDKNTTFDECVKKGLPDCQLKKLWYQVLKKKTRQITKHNTISRIFPPIFRFPGFVDIFEDVGILQATVGPLNKPNSI